MLTFPLACLTRLSERVQCLAKNEKTLKSIKNPFYSMLLIYYQHAGNNIFQFGQNADEEKISGVFFANKIKKLHKTFL